MHSYLPNTYILIYRIPAFLFAEYLHCYLPFTAIQKYKLDWYNVSELTNLDTVHTTGELRMIRFSNFKDMSNKARLIYGITKLPSNFLVDDKGIIIAQDIEPKELDNRLENIINKKKPATNTRL